MSKKNRDRRKKAREYKRFNNFDPPRVLSKFEAKGSKLSCSIDGGKTWHEVKLQYWQSPQPSLIDFHKEAFERAHIMRIDETLSFPSSLNKKPEVIIQSIVTPHGTTMYRQSRDGGKTWEPITDEPGAFQKLLNSQAEHGLVIGEEFEFVPKPTVEDWKRLKAPLPASFTLKNGSEGKVDGVVKMAMDIGVGESKSVHCCGGEIKPDGIHYRSMEGEFISEPCCETFKCTKCGYVWKSCEEGWNDD